MKPFRLLLLAPLCAATLAVAAPYKADLAHSNVTAVFKQMNVPVESKFKSFNATLDYDAAHPENAKAQVEVDTRSLDLGDPEAMLLQLVAADAKALRADAFDLQQAALRRLELADHGQRADGGEALGVGAGLAHLAAAGEAHHAEGRVGLAALADHVEVADLEDAQWKKAAGKEHRSERKQWQ